MPQNGKFFAAVLIARLGGAILFGVYATTLAYVTIAVMIADNGLQIGTVREITANPDTTGRIFSKVLIAKTLLFLPTLSGLGFLGLMSHLSKLEWLIASLITVRTIIQSYCQVHIAVIKAMDRMHVIGIIQLTHSIILLVCLSVCYYYRAMLLVAVAVLVVGQASELTLEAIWMWNSGIRISRVPLRECWAVIHASTSVGVASGLSTIILRLDIILLSLIASAAVAGVFAAAQTVIVIAYLLGTLIASVLFPEMNRLKENFVDLKLFTRQAMVVATSFLVPCTLIGMAIGPHAMRALFGAKFASSARLLVLMLPATPFIVLNAISLHEAFALHKKKIYLGVYLTAIVFVLVADSALARRYGAQGIAVAVVVREVLIFMTLRVGLSQCDASHSRPVGTIEWRDGMVSHKVKGSRE